ncbi:4-hydroxy-tetrahydrodipicolinate reductase [Fulvimarina sp. 2208YS6-2-32]|uniref:4-hydroxy-tetrahydrodipicolinate reductase n=1 Tax=Fulvimarina uroteuthidis TaxID=3098149 RepID=A0ABU5I1F6_9HYPH|nr:4-hydroxy-tetrahydrodipicolinate reductase [Fulvimarina sp. 2208YS6-2-32]MDY8109204.1 4-hydroxy-tetrahydrodipicolinate reductase [Fulvimarina sp. 2208YS6-2-32]
MSETRIVVFGAAGRMGRTIIEIVAETAGAKLVAALEPASSAALGEDAGSLAGIRKQGVRVTSDIAGALSGADAVIDFSAPDASAMLADAAALAGCAHVIGTTGFQVEHETRIADAARRTAIVKSGNMSLGVNLIAGLVEQAARALPANLFDIEILEMHHRHKVDAPSGTALLLGEAAAKGRGIGLDEHAVRVRDGQTGPRQTGSIGFATLRGGSVVGEHAVILAGEGERIEISHKAGDRAIFARGAVSAALWTKGRSAGLYSMRDVLGLTG